MVETSHVDGDHIWRERAGTRCGRIAVSYDDDGCGHARALISVSTARSERGTYNVLCFKAWHTDPKKLIPTYMKESRFNVHPAGKTPGHLARVKNRLRHSLPG